jgi:hypothetical protein
VLYRHRRSTLGDSVAWRLPEDLYTLGLSPRLNSLISSGERVLNLQNTLRGVKSRRGDATFGEIVPHSQTITVPGFVVHRGEIATVEIGTEVKILAKAMIKQIDRVIGDLTRQIEQFRRSGGNPICIGIAGVNYAERYTSYERDRSYPTDGQEYKHPLQEAADAERHSISRAAPSFDEFIVLRFRALNEPPFPFEWFDEHHTILDYGAALTRIARKYETRFLR